MNVVTYFSSPKSKLLISNAKLISGILDSFVLVDWFCSDVSFHILLQPLNSETTVYESSIKQIFSEHMVYDFELLKVCNVEEYSHSLRIKVGILQPHV